jgi:glycosyltransferase involved in cell wall biosynthesis
MLSNLPLMKPTYTIVQIHSPEDKHFIKTFNCNQVICETIYEKGADYEAELLVDNMVGDFRKVYAKIYYDEFRFDKARNVAKSFANTKYIFSLDADETIIFGDIDKVIQSNKDCYSVCILSPVGNEMALSWGQRLFKREIDWVGYAHETPDTQSTTRSNIVLYHTGYADESKLYGKAKRNNDLIMKSGMALNNEWYREKLYTGLIEEFNRKVKEK